MGNDEKQKEIDMYCNQCGTQNSDSARFCFQCGKPMSQSTAPQNISAPSNIQEFMKGRSPESIQNFKKVLNQIIDESETTEKASAPIGKDLVELIYQDILDVMVESLQTVGGLDVDGSRAAAKISLNIQKAITHGDADKVLAELAEKYPVYRSLYDRYHKMLYDSSSLEIESVAFLRKTFLEAAIEYEKKGGKSPFEMIDEQVFHSFFTKANFWKNMTRENIDMLVKLWFFRKSEQDIFTNNPMIGLIYFQMLMSFGQTMESPKLPIGAFEMRMLLLFGELDERFKEKNWQGYDRLATDLLNEARKTGSPHLLAITLWKAANAKLLLHDKGECRMLLDELDKVAATALREQPLYTAVMDMDNDINILAMVRVAQDNAISMRKAL